MQQLVALPPTIYLKTIKRVPTCALAMVTQIKERLLLSVIFSTGYGRTHSCEVFTRTYVLLVMKRMKERERERETDRERKREREREREQKPLVKNWQAI